MAEGYGFTETVARKLLALIGESPIGGLRKLSQQDSRGEYRFSEWAPLVSNKSGETVPAYAAMAIDGVDTNFTDRHTLKIVKPATDKFRPIVFNGPNEIASNDRGICFTAGIIRAKYASGQSFAAGRVLGVLGWELTTTGRRFAHIYADGVYDATERVAMINFAPLGDTFPITLTQTGGAAGSASAPPTWTYTIKDDYTGATIASSVDPTASPHLFKRPAAGRTELTGPTWSGKATTGTARYNESGALVILSTNEQTARRSC